MNPTTPATEWLASFEARASFSLIHRPGDGRRTRRRTNHSKQQQQQQPIIAVPTGGGANTRTPPHPPPPSLPREEGADD